MYLARGDLSLPEFVEIENAKLAPLVVCRGVNPARDPALGNLDRALVGGEVRAAVSRGIVRERPASHTTSRSFARWW